MEILEIELKERFGLQDAIVVEVPEDEEYLRRELGSAAAKYFDENVGAEHRVGIGSGRTVFEMVSVLAERPRNIQLFPLAVVAQQHIAVKSIDANTAVNALWFKSRPSATASRFEIFYPEADSAELDKYIKSMLGKSEVDEYVAELASLDFYVFSCSNLRRDSQLIEIAASCGVSFGDLRKNNVIGDFVFNTVNDRGEEVPTCIEKRRIGINMDSLKFASGQSNKKVVLVAGGKKKFPVIKSGISARLFNVLITDAESAKGLIATDGS